LLGICYSSVVCTINSFNIAYEYLIHSKLQEEKAPISLSYPDWCRSAWDQYQSMVSPHLDRHVGETSLISSNAHSFKQYLIEDLRLLKDYDILAAQEVALVLFSLSPDFFVGDRNMISLLVSSVLPEKVGTYVILTNISTIRK
jgi:hypothetical protein